MNWLNQTQSIEPAYCYLRFCSSKECPRLGCLVYTGD